MQAERVPFLDTVEGEVLLFHAIADARPVGINAHFNMLQIWLALRRETPEPIQVGDLWAKLQTLYDMDALSAIDLESDKYYTDPTTSRNIPIPPPAPSDNLDKHPFFRREYALEHDEYIDSLIVARRMRSTPSVSPPPPPLPRPKGKGKPRGKKVKGLKDTGLVPDSDSSALTEDGQEEAAATPKGSAFTGTDAGTEEPEEEDADRDASPAPTKKARTAKATATKKAQAKTRAATAAKKKKRK